MSGDIMDVEFIFAEFGPRSVANQPFGDERRLDPTYGSIKNYFPNANIVVYTDNVKLFDKYPDVELRLIDVESTCFNKENPRWGWHCCDYFQAKGLLCSSAKVAISVDSDIVFFSEEVLALIPIIEKFGMCVPTNPRQMVKIDGIYTRGNDGDYRIDEDLSRGNILTYDLWWMGFCTSSKSGRRWLEEFCRLMELNPRRGPLQLTRASWNLGIFPYSMPKQWGVGACDIGCGDEIILHVGHVEVLEYYGGALPK